MELRNLAAVNELLGDPEALSDRYAQDGCLLARQVFTPDQLDGLVQHATTVLERWGVGAVRGEPPALRWTGVPLEFYDQVALHQTATLTRSSPEFEAFQAAQRAAFDQVCGCSMHMWDGCHFRLSIPDDPAFVTKPHQDGYALRRPGDYRRMWVALSHIPFGDGGLAVAVGTHRLGRLAGREFPEHRSRPDIWNPAPRGGKWGADPAAFGDVWHTAEMLPGDVLVFSSDAAHRGLPATSDRIRVALSFSGSAVTDPHPPVTFTASEDHQRWEQIQRTLDRLGLPVGKATAVRGKLFFTGLPVTDDTVREAIAELA